MKKFLNKNNIFSGLRLRQILNDLKLEKTTNTNLSDETKVRDVAWGNLREKMQAMDVARFEFYF